MAVDSDLLGPGSQGDLIPLVPLSPSFLLSHWEALDPKLSSQALMGHDAGLYGAPQRDAQVPTLRTREVSLFGNRVFMGVTR